MSDEPKAKRQIGPMLFTERRIKPRGDKPGAVKFDDLGNAQYQWKDRSMLEDGEEADTRRLRALSLANLVVVDDDPPPDQKMAPTNKHGVRLGYNPYESGRLERTQRRKPRDLRALSKWIETKKKLSRPESD